jgi:integral membrane sensor domain MASE1
MELHTRTRPDRMPPSTPLTIRARRTEPWVLPSLALGSLIMTFHQLLSDGGSLIARSWTGYPITGPVPARHGALTLLAQSVGVMISLAYAFISDKGDRLPLLSLSNPAWAMVGATGAYYMHTHKDWPGYLGGLTLAVVLMSIAPLVIQRAARAGKARGSARVFGLAWLTVSILDFLDTLTVAYAFVRLILH